MRMHNPAHPGRILAQFIGDRSVTEVARHLKVTRATLSRVVNCKAAISADMALRLEEVIGLDAETWLAMQSKRNIWEAAQRKRVKLSKMDLDKAA